MNSTLTISVQENLVDVLKSLGDPKAVIPMALRQFIVNSCLQKLDRARNNVSEYEQRYGIDYEDFNLRVTTDQSYLDMVNRDYPLWEADVIEWLHWLEEEKAWQERLEKALQASSPLPIPA